MKKIGTLIGLMLVVGLVGCHIPSKAYWVDRDGGTWASLEEWKEANPRWFANSGGLPKKVPGWDTHFAAGVEGFENPPASLYQSIYLHGHYHGHHHGHHW